MAVSPAIEFHLRQNLAEVRGRMADAARRAGRAPESVRLIGVTKYSDANTAEALVSLGLADLGESRPQELWRKAEALAGQPIRWHLIGHLQRNKLRRTLPLVKLLQSADSLPLIAAIDAEAARLNRPVNVLLEVNISGEAAKHGFSPDELPAALPQIAALSFVCVQGLMTMAALEGGCDRARRDFAALRQLREKLSGDCPPPVSLTELSMGMSGDFEEAIAEGATIVRVGSALFDGLDAQAATEN